MHEICFMPQISCHMFECKQGLTVFLQIRNSRWLEGVHWPKPDNNYRSLPLRLDRDRCSMKKSQSDESWSSFINEEMGQHEDRIHSAKDQLSLQDKQNDTIVRRDLSILGISGEMLESHIEKGMRSPIIATYRILMHRLNLTGDINGFQGHDSKAKLGETLDNSFNGFHQSHSSTDSSNISSDHKSPKRVMPMSRHNHQDKVVIGLSKGTKKSKTCCIL